MIEQLLIHSLLVAITVVAVACDLRTNRIPNRLVWVAILGGVSLNAVRGMPFLIDSLLGLGLALLIGVVPFAMGWLGAGDVKFLGVLGAIVGVGYVPRLFFYTVLLGTVLAAVALVLRPRRGLAVLAREVVTDLEAFALSRGRVLPSGVRSKVAAGAKTIPYGVAIGAGALFAVFLDPSGRWAGF